MKADYLLIAHEAERPSTLHISHHISLKKARQEARKQLDWEDKKIYKLVEEGKK